MRRTLLLLFLCAGACASTSEEQAVTEMRESLKAATEKDLVAARAHAERAAELRPGFVDPHMALARFAELDGDFDEARRHYRQVLSIDPTDTSAGVAIGFTFVQQGRFAEGREWFANAIDADPGCEPAAYNLGVVSHQLGDPELAATWFEVAAVLHQRDPRALVEIAKVRFEQGRFEEALQQAEAALRRYPASQGGQAVRARALAALGRN